MVAALGAVITRMRERMESVGEVDAVSQDVLIQLTKDLEKHHWMFQAEDAA
jgi:starvation-inducible DNA-binding protein